MRPLVLAFALAAVVVGRPSVAAADTIPFPGTYSTIQAAIDGAPDGSVIQLAPGHYHELLKLYQITRSLTLRGDPANPAAVILDGDGQADSVLRVSDSGSTLVVEGVTITGGHGLDGHGGAIFMNKSQPVFRDCVFNGNHADVGGAAFILQSGGLFQRCLFQSNTANGIGGAILMHDGSSTMFEDCRFLDNQAGLTEPVSTYGGALVVNDSSATFVGCTISRNTSKYAAGGIAVTAPSYDRPTQVVTLRDTEISENVTDRGAAAGLPAAEGGGMHVEDNAHAILERCYVHDNVAHRGGGLNVYRARYTITDSAIENNRADMVDGGAGTGGGIYAASVNTAQPTRGPAVVEIARTFIGANAAVAGGGMYVQGDFGGLTTNHATLAITDSLIIGNTASDGGAGIEANETDTTITGSLVASNVVGAGGSYGGGILSAAGSNLTLRTTTIAGNSTPNQGGGIYVDQGGHVDIADSEFFANMAQPTFGGGAMSIGQAPGPVAGPIDGTVTRTVIADNGPTNQIYEADCTLASWSTIAYTSNTFHTTGAVPYYRSCHGASSTVNAFNALAGKASGNASGSATFARFLAAPATVTPGRGSVLGWSVPGAGSLGIDHGVGSVGAPTSIVDVAPGATVTYALAAGATTKGTATVTVTCAGLGTPFPRTPVHQGASGDATSAVLTWYDATGAATYDVYADKTDDPTTLVAQDLTATTLTLTGLEAGATYYWKVVAKSPQCASTSAGPVFAFRAAVSGGVCRFQDSFADGAASDWTHSGKGTMAVVGEALRLSGAPMLTAMPPAAAVGDGSFALSLQFTGKRSEAHLVFAMRDKKNYREVMLQSGGRLRLIEHAGRRKRTVARAQHAFTAAVAATVRLDLAGAGATLMIDGAQMMQGTFSGAAQGSVGVRAVRGPFLIDDVCVAGP